MACTKLGVVTVAAVYDRRISRKKAYRRRSAKRKREGAQPQRQTAASTVAIASLDGGRRCSERRTVFEKYGKR